MQVQYDPSLDLGAQEPFAMEHHSVPRSYELDFSNKENIDEWYMVPGNSNFVIDYEYPQMPPFAENVTDFSYFTPQTPKTFGMNFGFSPVEKGEFLLVDPLLGTGMALDDGYISNHSLQPIEMPMTSPSSVSSVPEDSSWEFVKPLTIESVWDLSALHPDSCNILGRRNSEPFNWSGASTPTTNSQDEREDPSALLALSLRDGFRYPCPDTSCNKSFKRKEHAKRHYVTKHKPRMHYLQCEFCGKDTFTRRDNLNAHRRLHARHPVKNNGGVHFVPAALKVLQKVQKPTAYNGKLLRLHG
ncbi:related to zinc finger protein odd-paired-like (opl) [Fusarium mangiferae]|uniref:Related to zinc finger protein odd-paired-like (Opl) n=1 Tax=Fusarium mangiferae TaxID=192010 RepID=A0A1L7TP81_FUSMA|nr:uncharacterized protein FMAN_09891 [Fusarium mangiferae]CVL00450.1 related to zinc finger protein odd-paired-like (opl) [Fusarium mangiferae]